MPRWVVLLLVLVGLFCAVLPIVLMGDRSGGITRILLAISAGAVSLAAIGLLSPQWPPAFWSWVPLPRRVMLTVAFVGVVLVAALFVAALLGAIVLQ
jgi:hypothetical protein